MFLARILNSLTDDEWEAFGLDENLHAPNTPNTQLPDLCTALTPVCDELDDDKLSAPVTDPTVLASVHDDGSVADACVAVDVHVCAQTVFEIYLSCLTDFYFIIVMYENKLH